jgi:hypothetical protein
VHAATMGSHPAITGAISNHQSIPPHRMVMVAIDPLLIDRSTTGTIPAASSAPPMIPMALGTHAHAPLAQILLIGNLMTTLALVSADLTITLALVNADLMTTLVLASADLMTTLVLASADLTITPVLVNADLMTTLVLVSARDQERDQTIGVTTIIQAIGMSDSRVKTGEETIDALILSATNAHSQTTIGDQQDNIVRVLPLTRVTLAGKAVHGRAVKLRQKSSKSIPRAPLTMNSSRAITNDLTTMRSVQHHVTYLSEAVDQKGILHEASLDKMKRKSVMSHVYPMVASLKAHAHFNARKLASGQRSKMIPTVSLEMSRQRRKT